NGNIISLDFTDQPLSDQDIPLLGKLPRLERLILYGPQVTDAGVADVVKLEGVTDLGFFNSTITDAGLAKLTEMKQIRSLMLRRCTGITNDGLALLKEFPN